MVEQEFGRVQQHPKDVAQGFIFVAGWAAAVEVAGEFFAFFGRRFAGERGEEDRFEFPTRVQKRRVGDGREDLAFVEAGLVGDQLAVHHHQGLQDRRLRFGRPGGLGEEVAEDRPAELPLLIEVRLVARDGLLDARGRGEAVLDLVGRQPLHIHAGESTRVVLARMAPLAAQIVRPTRNDAPDDDPQVVVGVPDGLGQFGQQLRMAGGVRVAGFVDRIDESDAEELLPEPVGDIAGEERILVVGDPIGQFDARAATLGPLRPFAVRKGRRHDLLRVRDSLRVELVLRK